MNQSGNSKVFSKPDLKSNLQVRSLYSQERRISAHELVWIFSQYPGTRFHLPLLSRYTTGCHSLTLQVWQDLLLFVEESFDQRLSWCRLKFIQTLLYSACGAFSPNAPPKTLQKNWLAEIFVILSLFTTVMDGLICTNGIQKNHFLSQLLCRHEH